MSFEFILPLLRPIEPSFRRTTKRIATGLAPRKELKRRPFLGLHPGFAVLPQLFSQSELQCRHEHSLWLAVGRAVADGWGALVLSIGKALPIVVIEPIQLRSDFTRYPLPPNTLPSSYYFRHSNKHAAKNKFAGSQFQRKGCFAFVLPRMMQTGEEPVKVFLRLASLDL
jgi:hypothetical protein